MEKILTVEDVAEILQVKVITVREMFRQKRLRAFKVGKGWRTTETMLREDLDALARGEAPKHLPTPTATAAPAAAPAPTPAAPADRLPKVGRPAAPAAETADPAPAKPAKPPRAPRAPKPKPDEGGEEPPQQFLF
jgi:excisionase family DNA binding protein